MRLRGNAPGRGLLRTALRLTPSTKIYATGPRFVPSIALRRRELITAPGRAGDCPPTAPPPTIRSHLPPPRSHSSTFSCSGIRHAV